MQVEAVKIKDGYLIPAVGRLSSLRKNKIMLNIEFIEPEEDYKEMFSNSAWDSYISKQTRDIPSITTNNDIDKLSREFNLNAENLDDLLELK